MRYSILVLAAGLLLLGSCQKKTETTVVEDPKTEKAAVEVPEKEMCFLQVVSRDSIRLTIAREGSAISGTYKSLPYEKDKKTIIFKGTIKDNTVTAIGTVSAEGMTSEEEIVFTIENNQATVKVGEMIEGDDSVYRYKNKNTAYSQILSKVDCK